jgi:phage FluMu protein Com
MPIRFRCAYCNQLLGIARRKAGTVVRCPTCAGQVIVPSPPAEEKPEEPVFERNDFAEVLNAAADDEPGNVANSTAAGTPPGWKAHAKTGRGPARSDGSAAHAGNVEMPRPPGVHLSPLKATLLAILFILLVALAFVAGMLLGRQMSSGSLPFFGDADGAMSHAS